MENPEDTLRASIESAIENAGNDDGQEQRLRDEQGRFAADDTIFPVEGESDAPDAPVIQAEPAQVAAEPAAVEVAATVVEEAAHSAPSSWKPENREKFNLIDPAIREQILKREADFHSGISQFKQDANIGKSYQQAVQPYMQTIQQLGVDPATAVAKLFQTDHMLRHSDPQTKAALFAKMAQDYGVSLGDVPAPEPVDPRLQAVYHELNQTRQLVGSWQQMQEQAQQTAILSDIEKFAQDPKHVHFELVRPDMGLLIQHGLAKDMEDAYEKAVWARSDTRQSLIEPIRAEAQKSAATAGQAKRAQTAAVGIKGASPVANGIQPAKGSIRDNLEAQFG